MMHDGLTPSRPSCPPPPPPTLQAMAAQQAAAAAAAAAAAFHPHGGMHPCGLQLPLPMSLPPPGWRPGMPMPMTPLAQLMMMQAWMTAGVPAGGALGPLPLPGLQPGCGWGPFSQVGVRGFFRWLTGGQCF